MKTAVSIPDTVFKSAERLAERLGVSRSELYARAVEAYTRQQSAAPSQWEQLDDAEITRRINAALTAIGPAATAAAVGTTIGAGLVGLVVVSAIQSSDDKAVSSKVRNECLARKGYKLVPAKT